MKIKICGVRDPQTAIKAVELGANYIGINFVSSSKRYVNASKASEILVAINGKAKVVGVFQNSPIEQVNKITDDLRLDLVQLHGSESPSYCQKVHVPVIKSVPFSNDLDEMIIKMNRYNCLLFLLDRPTQGNGGLINPQNAHYVCRLFPCFIAGGLTPKNVASMISEIMPVGVDVASGVETNGDIDAERVKLFINSSSNVVRRQS
jgi:phosphoribosylanthranilate isomerase